MVVRLDNIRPPPRITLSYDRKHSQSYDQTVGGRNYPVLRPGKSRLDIDHIIFFAAIIITSLFVTHCTVPNSISPEHRETMDFRFFNDDNKENVDQNAKELKRRPMPSFLTHNQDNTHTYKVAGDTIQFFCSQAVILALILCNKMVQQQFLRHQAFLFLSLIHI